MTETEYTPPKVWTWNKDNGGRFANINRPIAGPTHEKVLPVGEHPFQLHSLGTPNGVKVTVMFEELLALGHTGAEYDAWLIKIDGNQFGSGFVAVNPNSKIPALMDRSGPQPIRLFESGAILVHLAEKFGAFLPAGGQKLLEHDGDLDAVRSSQRIELERMAADRQLRLMRGAGDRAIDAGKATAAFLVPGPDLWRLVSGGIIDGGVGHSGWLQASSAVSRFR